MECCRAYLTAESLVDVKKVGIEGVSRYGKAALVKMAFDQRFAMVLVGSSGEGGASLYRRNFGEAIENLTGSGEYHWMAGRSDDYHSEKMPAVNVDLLDGDLAWRQHDGGHTDAPNISHFNKWARTHFASVGHPIGIR